MNPGERRSREEQNSREELTKPPGSGGLFMMGVENETKGRRRGIEGADGD